MNRRSAWLAAVVVVVSASGAWAQEGDIQTSGGTITGGSGNWSLYSGRTVNNGNALGVELGWPGINVNFLHAANSAVDLGARFTFNYGTEVTFNVSPAMNLHFLLRFGIIDKGIFSMALEVEPGLGFFFLGGGGMIIHIPAVLQMGIHPVRSLAILLGLEFRPQIIIAFGGGGGAGFGMPMLFANPGVEYALSESVALNFRMAFGPGIVAAGGGTGVGFSFRALMGVSFKF
ncbi:MAG: hypothetical protein AB1730_12350 [Myxococcota bacterium]|jgi:hypothetical protein